MEQSGTKRVRVRVWHTRRAGVGAWCMHVRACYAIPAGILSHFIGAYARTALLSALRGADLMMMMTIIQYANNACILHVT